MEVKSDMHHKGMRLRVRLTRYPGQVGWMHDVEICGDYQRWCHGCDGHVYSTQKAAVEAGVRFGRRLIDDLLE